MIFPIISPMRSSIGGSGGLGLLITSLCIKVSTPAILRAGDRSQLGEAAGVGAQNLAEIALNSRWRPCLALFPIPTSLAKNGR